MYYIHKFKIHARVNLLKPSQTFVLDSFPSNKNKNKKTQTQNFDQEFLLNVISDKKKPRWKFERLSFKATYTFGYFNKVNSSKKKNRPFKLKIM